MRACERTRTRKRQGEKEKNEYIIKLSYIQTTSHPITHRLKQNELYIATFTLRSVSSSALWFHYANQSATIFFSECFPYTDPVSWLRHMVPLFLTVLRIDFMPLSKSFTFSTALRPRLFCSSHKTFNIHYVILCCCILHPFVTTISIFISRESHSVCSPCMGFILWRQFPLGVGSILVSVFDTIQAQNFGHWSHLHKRTYYLPNSLIYFNEILCRKSKVSFVEKNLI